MITVAIIAVIAAIAYPSYTEHVTRTRRAAAAGCLTEIAHALERTYTTSMSYTPTGAAVMPGIACITETGDFYTYAFDEAETSARKFALEARPSGPQATADTKCANLTLNDKGEKGASGPGTRNECWR